MAYYPETGKMEVLMDGLHFASGVQISPEGDYVLVVELGASRVMKYEEVILKFLILALISLISEQTP